MKTRFTSLVKIKKNQLQKCELVFEQTNTAVKLAVAAVKEAVMSLNNCKCVRHGKMQQFLADKAVLDYQRRVVEQKKAWLSYAQNDLATSRQKLKEASLEYEKFKYLELEEIKKILKEQRFLDAKEMDEIAMLGYNIKGRT